MESTKPQVSAAAYSLSSMLQNAARSLGLASDAAAEPYRKLQAELTALEELLRDGAAVAPSAVVIAGLQRRLNDVGHLDNLSASVRHHVLTAASALHAR